MTCCTECGSTHLKAKGLCPTCYARAWDRARRKADPEKFKQVDAAHYKDNQEKKKMIAIKLNRKRGVLPFSENRSCSSFLGVHVAEQVLFKIFKNVTKMPYGNPGYDFICNKGRKVDVKSSCTRPQYNRAPSWSFKINRNEIADYFLCIAFDNRTDLNPLHLWLIPGNTINRFSHISASEKTMSKWNEFLLPLDNVIACCDSMK